MLFEIPIIITELHILLFDAFEFFTGTKHRSAYLSWFACNPPKEFESKSVIERTDQTFSLVNESFQVDTSRVSCLQVRL